MGQAGGTCAPLRSCRTGYACRMKRFLFVAVILTVLVIALVVGIRALRHRPDEASVAQSKPWIVVVVDPAHGGRDPGANAEGVFEKDIVLAIANKVSALSVEHPSLKVVLTRATDVEVVSDERIALAAKEAAALYVAIHVNAFDKPSANGIETWVDNTRAQGDPSWTLARALEKAVIASSGAKDRGVRTQDLFLRRLTIPAAATEVGFVTSPDERAKLLDPAYQELVARGILQGIADYVATTGMTPVVSTGTQPTTQAASASTQGTAARSPGTAPKKGTGS